eukprot:CAMPEP_0181210612 /NCGR_PEP_ID=MMETSP1096-20121128/23329_1 /TAXON_ID=156174 ORGANISM="Chrysochromulina ericina, Strain CCMP281" /NCGR_SAMPLE_ID=MMETSP1096 /ASSEMBLY_ACC=CAM_ASM_000453 /LENGTH=68 /DNA_ID=CAMNT_0023301925 /DNA_START=740 /DNA_END=942 /DNA_ORIENTATION=+
MSAPQPVSMSSAGATVPPNSHRSSGERSWPVTQRRGTNALATSCASSSNADESFWREWSSTLARSKSA